MTSPAASTLAALRRSLAALEAARLPRTRLPGGGPLRTCAGVAIAAALHEIAAARESELTAATGFVLPLAAWAASKGAMLWIAEEMALNENGALYGPGLDAFGLPPERLLRVAVAHERDVLWAMEEGLRCRGVGAVIGEIRGTGRGIGLTASRRLSLAAGRDVIFDIDWQGAQQLAEQARDDLVSVFILPPSTEELDRRLHARAQDPEEVVAQRMAKAGDEMSHWAEYDFIVVNRDVEDSVTRIRAILAAERLRRRRQIGLSDFVKRLQEGY